MSNIIGLNKEFQSLVEAEMFVKAQHNTIVSLTKKIQKLEEEKAHLEKLLSSSTPLVQSERTSSIIQSNSGGILTDDEESICRMQLKKLRDKSLTDELTLEEAKRVEIYTKILIAKQNQPKTLVVESKNLSNDQMLAAFEELEKNDSGKET